MINCFADGCRTVEGGSVWALEIVLATGQRIRVEAATHPRGDLHETEVDSGIEHRGGERVPQHVPMGRAMRTPLGCASPDRSCQW